MPVEIPHPFQGVIGRICLHYYRISFMPIALDKLQSFFDEVAFIYACEKKLTLQLNEIKSDGHHFRVKQGLALEAEENQRQCQRLEALFELLKPLLEKEHSEDDLARCFNQTLDLFDRFTLRHRAVGYDTSMLIAEVMGRTDILKTLEFCMKNELTNTTKSFDLPTTCH